jgi:hypothetical protein
MSVDCDCLSLFLLFVIIDGQVSARDNSQAYTQVPQAIVARTCKKIAVHFALMMFCSPNAHSFHLDGEQEPDSGNINSKAISSFFQKTTTNNL